MNKITPGKVRGGSAATNQPGTKGRAMANRMIIAGTQYFGGQGAPQPRPMPVVVVVYNDIHAAQCAAEAVEYLVPKFSDLGCERLLPVPVDQLHDPDLFDRLLSDAHEADMIIISYNGLEDFPAPLKNWIEACLLRQREGHAAVVALLSANEELDPPDSPRYEFFKNAAWAAGLAFIPPAAGIHE